VIDAEGRVVSREISSPDEVEPLGEALLAKPAPAPEPPPPPPPASPPVAQAEPAPVAPPASSAPKTAAALAQPRALVSALVGPRYAGAARVIWGGATIAGVVPFGPWAAGAWVRYDALSARLDHTPEIHELCIGVSAGRTFTLGQVDLRASALGSAAVVTRGHGHPPDETRLDGRLGAELRGALPLTSYLRAVAAIDAEIAPGAFDSRDHADPSKETPTAFPTYTVGVALGVELAVR